MTHLKLLVIDDDEVIGFAMADYFGRQGYQVELARSCAAATAALARQAFDLAVLDHRLPDGDGVGLVASLLEASPHLGIVVVTGSGSIDLAVRAMRDGAQHFLTKPFELPALALLFERVLQERRNARVAASTRAARVSMAPPETDDLSPTIAAMAGRAAAVASSVLILGETGTGKGVLARWLHEHGPAATEAMIELNCAGLSRELLESELFGHERGAFTGATQAKPGLFEIAHHGTIFLDEVAELDLIVQAKLLKVLEDQRFRRLGGTADRQVAVRVVAATSRDIDGMVERGEFRADLYFRLATLLLEMPPLRDRKAELPALVRRLLWQVGRQPGRGVTPAALAVLADHDWPGNVRELRNVLERAALFAPGLTLDAADIAPHLRSLRRSTQMAAAAPPVPERLTPPTPTSAPMSDGPRLTLAELERRHIVEALVDASGRVELAAEWLGIPRSTLYERMRRFGISSRDPRGAR